MPENKIITDREELLEAIWNEGMGELMGLYPEIVGILDVTDHTNRENAYM